MQQSDYKPGTWLKCIRTGKLTVIIEEKWYNSRTLQAFVLKSCIRPGSTMELYPCEIAANFIFCPAAQVLLGSKV